MTMKSKEVLGVGVALSTLVTSRSIFAQTDRTHMCCSETLGTEPKNFARGAVKHARIIPRGGVWQCTKGPRASVKRDSILYVTLCWREMDSNCRYPEDKLPLRDGL